MLGETDLLALGDRHLHAADGATAVRHRGHNDMALFIETRIKTRDLRLQLILKSRDGVVEGIEVTAVTCLMMLVAGENQLLELLKVIKLTFHILCVSFGICSYFVQCFC